MRLDHVSYAAGPGGLASTAQRVGAALGVGLDDGGIHPRFGTRNYVLPLAGGRYLEVVGALDHPAADAAPFGRAVVERSSVGGGWLAWVVATDDIDAVAARLGRAARAGDRHLPDGTHLRWRQVGVLDVLDDPQLPFFVEWDADSVHPSAVSAPHAAPVRLERLELSGDRERVLAQLGGPGIDPFGEVVVDWVDADRAGVVAAHFATPRGPVRLD